MADMLVKLYEVKDDLSFLAQQERHGIRIRKPIGPEARTLLAWIEDNFNRAWASEAGMALANRPISLFVAVREREFVGFACYDGTVLGFFGPTGVLDAFRGKGTGRALLLACLLDMKAKGYAYAVIGGVGPTEFYRKCAGAIEIPGSSPGVYGDWVTGASKPKKRRKV